MKILFVCRGNVGRSQFAEALFNKYIKGDFKASSAGTKLSGPEQPLSEIAEVQNVIDTLKEEGVNVSSNYRNQLTEEMFNRADKVFLIVDEFDPIPDYVQNNEKVTRWEVDNPKGLSLERHKEIKNQIKNLILNYDFSK